MRHYTGIDRLINSFDQALRSLVPGTTAAQRSNPAEQTQAPLTVSDARHGYLVHRYKFLHLN